MVGIYHGRVLRFGARSGFAKNECSVFPVTEPFVSGRETGTVKLTESGRGRDMRAKARSAVFSTLAASSLLLTEPETARPQTAN